MLNHMKTTLNISDAVMERLRRESARTGRTMSELMETALRRMLEAPDVVAGIEPLPTFSGGRVQVDVADRDALHGAMGGR
jgi:urease gamma subunit